MIGIALYKPDIPQNTASIIRLSACFNINVHIIQPCGFNLKDSDLKKFWKKISKEKIDNDLIKLINSYVNSKSSDFSSKFWNILIQRIIFKSIFCKNISICFKL